MPKKNNKKRSNAQRNKATLPQASQAAENTIEPTKAAAASDENENNVKNEKEAGLADEKMESVFNHCRIHHLLISATAVLLEIFRVRWSNWQLLLSNPQNSSREPSIEWKDGSECGEKLFAMCNEKQLSGKDIKEKIRAGQSATWDITILVAAIQSITQMIQREDYLSKKIWEEDKHIGAIRIARNEYSHLNTHGLNNEQFEDIWDRLETALSAIGPEFGLDPDEMEKIKCMDFSKAAAPSDDAHNSKAEQLKEEANKAFREGKYSEATQIYTQILDLPVPLDFLAIIYSNRSVTNLMLETKNALENAIKDAKMAVQMRPSWWRAHYRLGCAYRANDKLAKAIIKLNHARTLGPTEQSVVDELSRVQKMIAQREAQKAAASKRIDVVADRERKTMLNENRKIYVEMEETTTKNSPSQITFCAPFAYDANMSAEPPSLIGLKAILLSEMQPDNIYNGSVLELKVVDFPFVMASIVMVVEDRTGRVQRLSIHNWRQLYTYEQIMPTFQPHRKLNVVNPYLRITADGSLAIRAEDPKFVMPGELLPGCNCCGSEDRSVLKCANCRMVAYCSKGCQRHDWTEFGHKLVCHYLARYSFEF